MKWFGFKAAQAIARPFFARPFGGGWGGGAVTPLGDWPASYEAQVRAGVIGNPVAQRAVRLVCESVGSVQVLASGGGADASTDALPLPAQAQPDAAEGPSAVQASARLSAQSSARASAQAAALALIDRRSGGQRLIETLAMHLLLHGNGYVQIACDADGMPAELFALRPERVSVEADTRGWPMAYRYRVGDHVTRLWSEDAAGRIAIIHLKSAHPLDDHYGLGCAGAAAGAVAIHNAATLWNKALLDNAARPSGALVHDPGADGVPLSPDQFDRLKAELESAFQGAGNAGRPMLLEGGLKWQSMSLTPADMDFVGLKSAAAREIALAFGVPPMLIGLPGDNAYANYREANKALWRQSVLPMAAMILGGIAQGLSGWWPGLVLRVDMDAVPALADERSALWERVAAADFLSGEEKRAMLGIGVGGRRRLPSCP
ncbi:phage portal protein [Sphingobium algorifonticola]|uniref:Phage portal protein n=1 Tax=Sphingobium algorifonticola TaxID=2008318 RepID=A0A437JC04_9SPHN|nr:phage portal protein [Sphingobium algorifonticola]RVT43437.1 phage portal protein [Sphingobium algorifonticola]